MIDPLLKKTKGVIPDLEPVRSTRSGTQRKSRVQNPAQKLSRHATVAESTCMRGLVYKGSSRKEREIGQGALVCFCFFPHLLLPLVGPFGQGLLSVKALGFLAPRICLDASPA
jgi:nitrate reductase NapE component